MRESATPFLMKKTIETVIWEKISNSLLRSEGLEEVRIVHAIQEILKQFLQRNKTIKNEEIWKLYLALSKLMDIAFSEGLGNNKYVKFQRDNIAIVFIHVAQKFSIESIDNISPVSSSSDLSDHSIECANFALSIVADAELKKQIQRIMDSQIIHNRQVCEMAENTKEEIETQWSGSTQRLIKNLNDHSSKEIKPTENSAKILVWIIIIIGAILLTIFGTS